MKLLSDVDADEVSPVRRGANRRRFALLKEDAMLDPQVEDILAIPWEHEGKMLDGLRADGADETVQKAAVGAIRLLKGIEDDLPETMREAVEKLGTELYARDNPKLNQGGNAGTNGELVGSADTDEDLEASASGPDKDASVSGPKRDGSASGDALNKDDKPDGDDAEPDNDADDVAKRDVSAAERKRLASQGKALPDKSFPIDNVGDLKNAIKLAGKSKDPGKAKAFIVRRAKALGATNLLPDSWSVGKADPDADTDDDHNDDVEKGDTVSETHAVPIQKEDGTWDLSGVPEDSRPYYESVIKSNETLSAENTALKERVEKAEDALATREFVAKAQAFGKVAPADELAGVLKEASAKLDPETVEKLDGILKAANERIDTGDLFRELGRTSLNEPDRGDSAWSKIEKMAGDLVEKSGELSEAQAIDRVLKTAEGKRLYSRYLEENPLPLTMTPGGVS